MPTNYKISGNLSENARIIIIKQSDWSVESNTEEASGTYEKDPVSNDTKLVVALKSNGDAQAYGNVTPVSYEYNAMYVFAGQNGSYLRDTDEYVPDTWTAKSDMPTPVRERHASSGIDSKCYIYGGWYYDGTIHILQDTDEYLPDSWTSKSNMPSPARRSVSSTTISNKGYVFGGHNGSASINDTDEYDPDSWTSKTNMLRSDTAITSVTINSKGYTLAGESDRDANYEYNPDTWASKTNIPANHRRGFGFEINDKGYIVAGDSILDNHEYDIGTDSWTERTSIPQGGTLYAERDSGSQAGASSTDNKGYCFGGDAGGAYTYMDRVDEYDSDTWTTKSSMPTGKMSHSASTI